MEGISNQEPGEVVERITQMLMNAEKGRKREAKIYSKNILKVRVEKLNELREELVRILEQLKQIPPEQREERKEIKKMPLYKECLTKHRQKEFLELENVI